MATYTPQMKKILEGREAEETFNLSIVTAEVQGGLWKDPLKPPPALTSPILQGGEKRKGD